VVVYDGDHWGPMSKRGMLESMQVLARHPGHLFAVSAKGRKSLVPGLVYLRYDWYAYERAPPGTALPPSVPEYLEPVLSSFSGCAVYLWRDYRRARYSGGHCEHKALHAALRILTGGRLMAQNHRWPLYIGGDHSSHG
jgi:hypothetical protein